MDYNKSDNLEKCDFFHNFCDSVIKPESSNCVHLEICFTKYLTSIDDTIEIQFNTGTTCTCNPICLRVHAPQGVMKYTTYQYEVLLTHRHSNKWGTLPLQH